MHAEMQEEDVICMVDYEHTYAIPDITAYAFFVGRISQCSSFSRNRDGTITFSVCQCEHLQTACAPCGHFLPQTTETLRMAQYLDVESGPDMIDITSDISSSTEEEGNWPPHELQGGAGILDADFDADMYPQPNRTVSNHNHDIVPEDTLTTFLHYFTVLHWRGHGRRAAS